MKTRKGLGALLRRVEVLGSLLLMGVGPASIPAGASPFAYVANSSDNTVSVVDTRYEHRGDHHTSGLFTRKGWRSPRMVLGYMWLILAAIPSP